MTPTSALSSAFRARRHPRRVAALVATAAVCVTGVLTQFAEPVAGAAMLTAGTETAGSAATSIRVDPAAPIAEEQVRVSGGIGTKVVRLAYLQRYDPKTKTWKSIANTKTTPKGAYAYTTRMGTTAYGFRAFAPKVKIKKTTYPAVTTAAKWVKPVRQSGSTRTLPQIVQAGKAVAAASAARALVVGQFKPTRIGRVATLQRLERTKWTNVATTRQDVRGQAVLAAPATVKGKSVTYRYVLAWSKGAKSLTTGGASTAKWAKPSFSDEFGGTKLAKWWRLMDPDYGTVGNRKCSRSSLKAVSVGGGSLALKVMKDPARPHTRCLVKKDGKRYAWRLNGNISTRNVKTFGYGVAAARIRYQPSRGQHGAFWLFEGSKKRSGHSTEVDVAEWFGTSKPLRLSNYVYQRLANQPKPTRYGGDIAKPENFLTGKGDSYSGGYHVFSVERTPSGYTFRVDGKISTQLGKGVTGRRMFIWLSLISGDYELRYQDEKKLPQQMNVDWVRFWPQPK